MVAQKEMLPNGNHSVSERTIASQNQNGIVLNNPRDSFGEELSLHDSGANRSRWMPQPCHQVKSSQNVITKSVNASTLGNRM
jgi:hypothetical protein